MLKKAPIFVWISLSASLLILAVVLTFPGALGFSRSARIVGIKDAAGSMLAADLPQGIKQQRKREFLFPDYPVICEDGKPLRRPRCPGKEIANAGRGRYEVSGSQIRFSTSDGGPAAERVYTIRSPIWSLREPLLLAIWLVGMQVAAITVCLAAPHGITGLVHGPRVALVSLAFSLILIAVFIGFRPVLSDRFFLGLLFPAIWAALMGVNAGQRHVAGRVGLMVLALLPAVAGYYYYGINAASDSSFLVAGTIPCSDAWIHFLQSAEIAIKGSTQFLFNGRFLYPAFYAVLLKLAGLNILVANLLISSLVMLGLALACGHVAKRVGIVGTAIFCLLFWLYFRAHGCGLLMSENLGLLLGTLGFCFLLLSVDGNRIWPVFASILLFGLGSAARPGALFILPALALYLGVRVWRACPIGGRLRIFKTAGAFAVGLAVIAGCFGANRILMKSFYRGEGKSFGNFAFTLSGLLNDTKWSTSYEAAGGNASLVMEQNIRQLKESPGSLLRGIERAYEEGFKTGFLFRFGDERRFASGGMALFFLASLSCWLWKPLRRDSGWILLLFAGIIASIPFAPPWDAGERPYAVTMPVQIFLAAAGVAMLFHLLHVLADALVSGDPCGQPVDRHGRVEAPGWRSVCGKIRPQDIGRTPMLQIVTSASRRWAAFWSAFQKTPELPVSTSAVQRAGSLIVFAVLCIFLTLPAPLLMNVAGVRHPTQAFLPGSQICVFQEATTCSGCVSRTSYLDRLSDFSATHPEDARFYTSAPGDFFLAINWLDLQAVVLPFSAQP